MPVRSRVSKHFCALITIGVFLHFALASGALVAAAATPMPPIESESYLLADFTTGRILAAYDGTKPHIPASLTKIMTMYILFDAIGAGQVSLDDMVAVSEKAWATEGSKMYILVGTEVKLEDLVKGITVMSGNDACVSVAEHVAGNETSFVDRMNRKAKDLGLANTVFVDPHGLSDDNRTTAEDLLRLTRSYLAVHPQALKYHSIKEFEYTAPGESQKSPQFNRNKLLWVYPGAYGLKTGFTTLAGYNMIALVERDGLHAIAIVLGSGRGLSIDEGERVRSDNVISMLDWAYSQYSYVSIENPRTVVGTARVWKGKGKFAEAITITGLGVTVEKDQVDKIVTTYVLKDDLTAPVAQGAVIGEAVFTVDGQEIGSAPLVAKSEVPKGNIFRVIWDSVLRIFSRVFHRKTT